MEISYSELRCKEVVNVLNGARMGKIIDMIIQPDGKNVLGLVVPGVRKMFKANEDIFIPWGNISKIGEDVIMVSVDVRSLTTVTKTSEKGKRNSDCNACDADFIE